MAKKSVNISLDAHLLAEAKAYNVNISQVTAAAITQALYNSRKEAWYKENAKAIEADQRFLEENGIWNEEFRPW
jgi:antitoxin CcdA